MSTTITLFGSAVLAVLLAGYLAQHYLPPPKPTIIGIDLGTTFSCVGVYHAGSGNVSVITDQDGRSCIPSIVAFTPQGILVGYDALAQAEYNPKNTFYDAKRFIGKSFTKAELRAEARSYAFKIKLGPKNDAYFLSDYYQGEISPELVGSHVVRRLRETAERNLCRSLTRAVISVPAEFNAEQRNSTKTAAGLAGVEVVRVINEPTAAAMAYGLHQSRSARTVLVLDLGGGTLDVSLLNVQGGMFLTMAMAGNNHLGGQDLNQNVLSYLLGLVHARFAREVRAAGDLQALRSQVEAAKLQLSDQPTATIHVRLASLGATFTHTLTREQFVQVNEAVLARLLEPVTRALHDADLHKDEVDDVVLVGGSTRIPHVRDMVRQYFGKDPNVSIDPELAVTRGVAAQAGVLGGAWPLRVSAVERPVRVRKSHLEQRLPAGSPGLARESERP